MQIISILYSFKDITGYVDKTFTAHFFYIFLKYLAIPFLIIVLLYFIVLLILSRFYLDKLSIKKSDIDKSINDFLTDLIFSNYSSEETKLKIDEFKKSEIFQNKWCKHLILNKLIHIKQNIKEVNQNLVLIIYKQFDLNLYSEKLISRKKWYYKSLGFYHYQSLDYKIKKRHIKPYLSSKNRYLKSNALIALIALSDEKFDILNNYHKKIPNADELKILDLIYQKESVIPESINTWLENSNSSIIILAIKLIVRYREPLTLSKITYLLLHPDKNVRKEIILAIRELVVFDANDILIAHFKKESDIRNKISILKTLGAIGGERTKDFATQILFEEKNIDIKFEIINCINRIDKSYFNNFKIEDEDENNLINKIILHVNNPYLN
ncbi:MAG: HEAT repeat domain-containing protein [Flavobacterium sp.]|uniref:HEAT repeat domain-containing protein n=1 Tax=Flavobacterium sp. TaxID=239 RepID=UPI0032676CA0